MQELKAEKPIESPVGSDPVLRLMAALADEGFTTEQGPEWWDEYGEIIYRREEQVPMTKGETVFIFTRLPELNERILRQTSESVVNTYRAKSFSQKAMAVLQSTTVYHCLVTTTDQPHNEFLNNFIHRLGGATFIPVIIVPEINQVVYPNLDEKIGTIRPRVEYLQFLLGERREQVNMHRSTVQAFYVSIALIAVILILIAGAAFTKVSG